MVSVGVSALGHTDIHFVEPGVKINGEYYRDVLLNQKLLPDIRQFSGFYIFQQDGAPAHRARDTVAFLQKETRDFIPPTLWPPNSPDFNPVNYGVQWKKTFTERRSSTLKSYANEFLRSGKILIRRLLTRQSSIGVFDLGCASMLMANILNINSRYKY